MSGGGHNFAVDRAVGERIEEVVPGLRTAALGAGFGGMRRVAARGTRGHRGGTGDEHAHLRGGRPESTRNTHK
ncbi:hypothetical protein NUG22_16660 [Saccharothrix longispora]|nr:hypothetical protein [Saccharothrix longispora]MDU0290853.1 hypothetical protein [Saccharothrix longispora]